MCYVCHAYAIYSTIPYVSPENLQSYNGGMYSMKFKVLYLLDQTLLSISPRSRIVAVPHQMFEEHAAREHAL